MTFTEEQIREAFDKVFEGEPEEWEDLKRDLIEALNRPQPEFREGEVIGIQRTEGSKEWTYANFPKYKTYCPIRKLRLSELPEAVERLRKSVEKLTHPNTPLATSTQLWQSMKKALADFDREISDDS